MIRIKVLLLSLIVIFSACKKNKKGADAIQKETEGMEMTPRDRSVTMSNAYNDMFLDSVAVEQFITQQKLNSKVALNIRRFYNARNFEYAWLSSNGLIEQALNFRSMYQLGLDSLDNNKALEKKIDGLRPTEDLSISPKDSSVINVELLLTKRFVKYLMEADTKVSGNLDVLETFIPAKRYSSIYLTDSLLAQSNHINKKYATLNAAYGLLKTQLKIYNTIAKNGGWESIPTDVQKFKKGSSLPVFKLIRQRLQRTGELAGKDTSSVYDSSLVEAVKKYQISRGDKPTGLISVGIIKDMNVPVEKRIQQLLVNMQRMRWMPFQPDGKLIIVNIPEFMLRVKEDKNQVFDMRVVVGAEGNNTTMFSGSLSMVVFSPYWNIPPSIVRKEILPGMKRNEYYLDDKNMEILRYEHGLPVVRQLPGPDNSLGKVKFLFPNSFNIYFHDTPAKSLFNRNKRAFSHGCIRLSDPVRMANYLLQDSPVWTPDKIAEAMDSGEEKYVKLKDPVPVVITYYTAWVGENNILHFRDDIYGHDSIMTKKMFTDTVQPNL